MSRASKTILATTIILLSYGYLSRLVPINFFWDSKALGWILLFITLLSYWIDLRRERKRKGKKLIWVTFGICFLTFGLLILPYVIFELKTSEAYGAATEYLQTSQKIKEEVGEVRGFGLITTGSVGTTTINGAESGSASLEIIVRGSKKYKDVRIDLEKTPGTSWTVTIVK